MSRAATAVLIDDLLASLTDDMVEESLAYREEATGSVLPSKESLESTSLDVPPRTAISQAAYDFVVRWETGGRAYYDRVIKGRPVWPGFSSGITIGCGFDLGYHDEAAFALQWQSRLAASDFARLARTLGFRTTQPDRERKVAKAHALVRSLSDIVVAWTVAIEQFDAAKLPKLVRELYGALDNLDRLHPHARGSLLSLVFNRGPAFRAEGDRFREMRAIHAAMSSGRPEDFARIPSLLRSMRRIWGEASSLAERREGEAKLFEAGLAEQRLLESLSVSATGDGVEERLLESAAPVERHEELPDPRDEEPDDPEQAALEAAEAELLETSGLTPASVRWNPRDDEQPDYRHLDRALVGANFDLRAEDLALLIEANDFAPLAGRFVFALRGAALAGERPVAEVTTLPLRDRRPDHREPRCVIGVCDPASGRLWAYPASTVPNAAFVFKCYAAAQAGTPLRSLMGNILPTGCYTYTVGTHKRGRPGEIPGVLRLSTTATGASEVVVLRSLSDVVYDRFDRFVIAAPADNLHPAILSAGFSSAGCLTIPGRFHGGRHQGSWADFRVAAGIDRAADGQQISLVLLTGLDAALAAQLRGQGATDLRSIRRLRHGSKGERAARLQRSLGLAPDAAQRIGPVTRDALVRRQAAVLGWADGIYSPDMDARLGFEVFG